MNRRDLGWNSFIEAQFAEFASTPLAAARVIAELKQFYRVHDGSTEYLAELSGKIRHTAKGRDDLPAVGDWVAITARQGEDRARIEAIVPRRTKLSRKVAGRERTEQIIASNLDVVFIVSALNQEFNLRRIERYLTLVWDSGAHPVMLLNKADLCSSPQKMVSDVEKIALGSPVHLLSAVEARGLESIREHLSPGITAALVGSSGVGKTTIINGLMGSEELRVQAVRRGDDRGKHTTTARQMIFLPSGAMVIDTPGMRELQLRDNDEGLDRAFGDIVQLASHCRFRDCSHDGEPGCAVGVALAEGTLDRERFESHRKLKAEMQFLERKSDPAAARAVKEEWKKIHKAMRNHSKGW